MGVPGSLVSPAGWGPGVALADVASALADCDAESALRVIEAMEHLKRWADGVTVAATRVLTLSVTADHFDDYARDHEGELSERAQLDAAKEAQLAVADDLAVAIGLGSGAARDLVGVACAAPERTAVGMAQMFTGHTTLHRVTTLWSECRDLPPRAANEIADKVLRPTRDGVPLSQRLFRQRLNRQLARHNTPKRRRAKALAARDISCWQHGDGTGEISIRGATERTIAAQTRISEIARIIRSRGDQRTLAQLRSDVALDLLLYGAPSGSDTRGSSVPRDCLSPHVTSSLQSRGTGGVGASGSAAGGSGASPQGFGESDSGFAASPAAAVVAGQAELPELPGRPGRPGRPGLPGLHRLLELPAQPELPQQPESEVPWWEAFTGALPPARVTVTVPLTSLIGIGDEPAEIDTTTGAEYVPAWLARDIAHAAGSTWRRLVTDPHTGQALSAPSGSYTPPPRMRDYVQARDHTCRAPGCTHPATRSDLDHTEPWPRGATSADNLGAAHRRHHNHKTRGLWSCEQRTDGSIEWTLTSGRTYTTQPHSHAPTLEDQSESLHRLLDSGDADTLAALHTILDHATAQACLDSYLAPDIAPAEPQDEHPIGASANPPLPVAHVRPAGLIDHIAWRRKIVYVEIPGYTRRSARDDGYGEPPF